MRIWKPIHGIPTSSDTSVAKVDSDGVITGVLEGSANITISKDGKSLTAVTDENDSYKIFIWDKDLKPLSKVFSK